MTLTRSTTAPTSGFARFLLASILVALLGPLLACERQGYSGPQKPAGEVFVVMRGETPDGRVLFTGLDGKLFSVAASKVELLPGTHGVGLTYWDTVHCIPLVECFTPTSYGYFFEADLTGAAGQSYVVHATGSWQKRPAPLRLWIVDNATGETVWSETRDSGTPNIIMK